MFDFDASSHTYRVDGNVVPGVTSLLAPLYEWAGIPEHVLEAKSLLGKDVHLACEYEDRGGVDDESIDESVLPYLNAYRRFKREHRVDWLLIEERRFHPRRGYAGTLDRHGFVDDVQTIVDLKTVATLHDAVGVQTAAYRELVIATTPIEAPETLRRHALQLRPDGTYRFAEYRAPDDLPCFLSLLTLHQWRARHQSKGSQ